MSEHIERSITEDSLPITKGVKVLHPELAVIRIREAGTVDMGALCYLVRSKKPRRSTQRARRVDPDSFDKARAGQIRELIAYLSDMVALGVRRPSTCLRKACNWIVFIDWCDANEYSAVLESTRSCRAAFRAYVGHLTDQVQHDILSSCTAANYQNDSLELLRDFHGLDDLAAGIKLIRKRGAAVEPTSVPDEEAQSRVLGLCDCLFNGLSELVIDNQLYPFRMAMPEYLNWNDPYLWVFPVTRWSMSPHLLSVRDELKNPSWAYDYARGRVALVEEIAHRYGYRCIARRAIENAEKNIADANSNMRHNRRIQAALLAHNAFVLLFVANTGMNWAQLADLQWNDNYALGVDSQGFREIKYRAANKTVSFRISVGFLPSFRRFLQLRKYLLEDEASSDSLFFSFGQNRQSRAKKLSEETIAILYSATLQHIDPNLSKVMPRAWRAAKSDWLVRRTDLSTAALILQNSQRTITHAYAQGSESRAVEELGQFFERVSRIVQKPAQDSTTVRTDSPMGVCTDYGNPNVEKEAPIEPDCHQAEGCLFCDKYAVHADEHDVRKLASCRYCISQTSHLCASKEHFDSIYDAVIQRIERLLEHISGLSQDERAMVRRVREEVEEDGDLDPYWARKFDMLIHLGVVSI